MGGVIAFLFDAGILFANDYGGFSCRYYTDSGHAIKFCEIAFFTLLPMIPLFLLSLITYKMRDEVFRAWWNFARWSVPLSIVVVLASSGSRGGSMGIPNIFDQEFFAFVFSALFLLISLGIIAVKWWKLRKAAR